MSELSSDICGVGGRGKATILVFLIYFIIIFRVVEGGGGTSALPAWRVTKLP
jgi:hypothetical protein